MKAKERAADDMQRFLSAIREGEKHNYVVNARLIARMNSVGWKLTPGTLLQTARDLGFTVIGEQIFLMDE